MAGQFDIVAQLQIQAPSNLSSVVNDIQRKLSGINATVNLNVNNASLNALGQLNSQLTAVQGNLKNTQSQLSTTTQGMQSAMVATKQAGDALENFGVQAGLAARRYSAFLLAGGAIVTFVNELRNAVGEALSFQREMIKVAQVGDTSKVSLTGLESTITQLSTTWGASSKSLLEATIQLRQAGLTAEDTKIALEALAKSSLAPSFGNMSETTEGLIAIMNQFKLSAKDAADELGSINAVSNKFAVSAADMIDAIRRTGGEFKTAGGNVNELLALFGSIRSTSRESAESIGSALKTILVRVQRSSVIEDMHQLGVELRYTREEAARMGDLGLTGQFVGPYEAVRRLSTAFKELRGTDIRYAAITEELGGYRQIQKLVPLLQEFGKAQAIYQTAQQGSNSLTKSAEQAQDAFLIKLQKVREEFMALVRTITESKGFGAFMDTVIQLTHYLNLLAGALTPLIPLLTVMATFKLAQNIGGLTTGLGAGLFGGITPPRFAGGGLVPGIGDTDSVFAQLTPGEYVIRKQAAQKIGYEKLARMNSVRMADGGDPRFYLEPAISDRELKEMRKTMTTEQIEAEALARHAFRVTGYKSDLPAYLSGQAIIGRQGLGEAGVEAQLSTASFREQITKRQAAVAGFEAAEKGIAGNIIRIPYTADKMAIVGFGPVSQSGRAIQTSGVDKLSNLNPKVREALLSRGITEIQGDVTSHVISAEGTERFHTEIGSKVSDAIAHTFKSIFPKSSHDFRLSTGQTQSINGYLLEQYITGLSGKIPAGGNTNFDFMNTGSFEGTELNDVIYPSPINANLIDAKHSVASANRYTMLGKYLNMRAQQGDPLLTAQGHATGGYVDSIPALLTPGEYVINAAAASHIGKANLDRMNTFGVAHFAGGGNVGTYKMMPDIYDVVNDEPAPQEKQYTDIFKVAADNAGRKIVQEVAGSVERAATYAMEGGYGTLSDLGATGRMMGRGSRPGRMPEGYGLLENDEWTLMQRAMERRALAAQGTGTMASSYRLQGAGSMIPLQMAPTPMEALSGRLNEAVGGRLAGRGQLSNLTTQQLRIEELNKLYQQRIAEEAQSLKATGKVATALERQRIAAEKVEAEFRELATQAGITVEKGQGVAQALQAAQAGAGGTAPMTRGERFGQWMRSNGASAAIMGLSMAGMYGAQYLDTAAGSADTAVAGGDTGLFGRYGMMKGGAGALSGAALGASIGMASGNPWGVAAGAAIGALAGFTAALMQAQDDLKKATFARDVKEISETLGRETRAGVGYGRTKQAIDTALDEAESQTRIKGYEDTWWALSKESSKDKLTRRASMIEPIRGSVETMIGKEAERAAGAGGTSGSIMTGLRTKFAKELDIFSPEDREAILKGAVNPALAQANLQGGENKASRIALDFDSLTSSLRNAIVSLNDFNRSAKTSAIIMSGGITAGENRNMAEGIATLGGPNGAVFNRSLGDLSAAFGPQAGTFTGIGGALDVVKRNMSSSILTLLQQGTPLGPEAFSQKLIETTNASLGGGRNQYTDKVLEIAKTQLMGKYSDEATLQKALAANPQQVINEILSPLEGPFKEHADEIGRMMQEASNSFGQAVNQFNQNLQKIGAMWDRASELNVGAIRTQAQVAMQVEHERMAGYNIPLQTLQAPFNERQAYLTGEAGLTGADIFDPTAIAGRLALYQGKTVAQQKVLDTTAQGTNAYAAAQAEMGTLSRITANLNQALSNLTDVAKRNAAIEEKLGMLRQDEEARMSLAEKFLTGDPASRREMQRGQILLDQAVKQGGLGGFGTRDIRSILGLLNSAPNLMYGNNTFGGIREQLLGNAPQLAGMMGGNILNPNINRGLMRQLGGQLVANAQVGAGAAAAQAANAEVMNVASFNEAINANKNVMIQLSQNLVEWTQITKTLSDIMANASAKPVGKAAGGPIFSPQGTDTVPAMLTPGEFVVNRESAKKYRRFLEAINLRPGSTGADTGDLSSVSHPTGYFATGGEIAANRVALDPRTRTALAAVMESAGGDQRIYEATASVLAHVAGQQGADFARATGAAGIAQGLSKIHIGQTRPGLTEQFAYGDTARMRIGFAREQMDLFGARVDQHAGAVGFFEKMRAGAGLAAADVPTTSRMPWVVSNGNIVGRLVGDNFVITDMSHLAAGQSFDHRDMVKAVANNQGAWLSDHPGWHIRRFASGGFVDGSDNIPAMLTQGEYVLNKNATQSIGVGNLNRLNTNGYNQNSGTDINKLQSVFNSFSATVTSLANMLSKIPSNIQLTANHTVNVNHNGAEAFAGMEESVSKMIQSHVNNALNNFITKRFPEAGKMTAAETQPLNV